MFATPLIVSLVESSIASLQLYKVLRKAVIFGSSITVFWNGSLRRIWHRLPSQYLSSHAHAICCGKLEWLASERRSSSHRFRRGPKAKPVFYAVRERSFCPKKGHNLSCSDLVSVHFRPG